MKINNAFLLLAAFVGGALAGHTLEKHRGGSDAVTTTASHSAAPTTLPANNNHVSSDDKPSAIAPKTTPSTISDSGNSDAIASSDQTRDWSTISEQANFREHLSALQFIDNATQSELVSLIQSLEQGNETNYANSWFYSAAVQRWAELDSQAVADHIAQQQEQPFNHYGHGINYQIEALRALALIDSDAAWELSSALGSGGPREQMMLAEFYAILAESDPLAALDHVMANSGNSLLLSQSIERIVMQWSGTDPQAALEWIEQNPDTVQAPYIKEQAILQLMYMDPQAGLNLLPSIDNVQQRAMLQAEYAGQLATHSPEEAYYWASDLDNSMARSEAQRRALETWGYTDPDRAIEFALSIQNTGDENDMTSYLISNAAHAKSLQDPQQAMAWIDTLPSEHQDNARDAVFYNWVSQAPQDAMQWLDYSANPQQKERTLRSIAHMLPDIDMPLAMQMFEEYDADTQMQMSYSIVQKLHYENPQSAIDWIDTLTDASLQEEARMSLIMMLAETQPQQALAQVDSLTVEQRQMLLPQLGMMLRHMHPGTLDGWMATQSLSETERTMLTNPDPSVFMEGMPGAESEIHYGY